MAKWWKGSALLALWLIQSGSAQAQQAPGRAASYTEPLPTALLPVSATCTSPGGCGAPPGGAGSIPGAVAAVGAIGSGQPNPLHGGQDPMNSLPANIPNAWDDYGFSCPSCYFFVGPMALRRGRMGNGAGPVAVLDPAGETGDPPPAGATPAQRFKDLRPSYNWGVRGTVGYHWDNNAIEASGWYLFQNDSFILSAQPGQLSTFFVNPPLGFEGNNFLFLHADLVRTSLQTALANAELNLHWWMGTDSSFHWFCGVRYLDVQETLRILVDDEGLQPPRPDILRQATYGLRAHNRIVAPQLGFEYSHGLFGWLAATINVKGAWGVNFVDVDSLLKRGDGFVGRQGNRDDTIFSQVYDGGLYLDFCLTTQTRFRAGYNIIWALDVAEAVRQVDYDLSNPLGMRNNDNGSIFYHGPVLELQVVF